MHSYTIPFCDFTKAIRLYLAAPPLRHRTFLPSRDGHLCEAAMGPLYTSHKKMTISSRTSYFHAWSWSKLLPPWPTKGQWSSSLIRLDFSLGPNLLTNWINQRGRTWQCRGLAASLWSPLVGCSVHIAVLKLVKTIDWSCSLDVHINMPFNLLSSKLSTEDKHCSNASSVGGLSGLGSVILFLLTSRMVLQQLMWIYFVHCSLRTWGCIRRKCCWPPPAILDWCWDE